MSSQTRIKGVAFPSIYKLTALTLSVTPLSELCLRFYGSVEAEVTFPGADDDHTNYNNTIPCPKRWSFDAIAGAILEICPPNDYKLNPDGSDIQYAHPDDGAALIVSLSLNDPGNVVSDPITDLRLTDLLITNSSQASRIPQSEAKRPAILTGQHHPEKSSSPEFTINGTASAIPTPTEELTTNGVYLGCVPLAEEDGQDRFGRYCGTGNDETQGGCWTQYRFSWRHNASLNYSIVFSDAKATVDIWTEAPYELDDGSYAGYRTAAHLTFRGSDSVPSVTAYEFWENTEAVYEEEKEWEEGHMVFARQDELTGLPILYDNGNSAWYSAANGSYSMEPLDGAAGDRVGGSSSLMRIFVTSALAGLFLW